MEIEIISSTMPQNAAQNQQEKTAKHTPPPSKPHQIILEKKQKEPPVTDLEIKNMLRQLKEDMRLYNRGLQFEVNKEINRVVVKVIDKNTDKVIKEIPPVEIQQVIASIRRSLGLLVDKQI